MGKRRWDVIGYLVLALGVLGAFGFQEFARRERVDQLNYINTRQCLEIELLKKVEREEALEDFRNLDRNLRILGIEKTPEIVETAEESRDRTLSRFRVGTCPREKLE